MKSIRAADAATKSERIPKYMKGTWTKINYSYMLELMMADHDARCPAGHEVYINNDEYAFCFECNTSWPLRVTVEVDWTKGKVAAEDA